MLLAGMEAGSVDGKYINMPHSVDGITGMPLSDSLKSSEPFPLVSTRAKICAAYVTGNSRRATARY